MFYGDGSGAFVAADAKNGKLLWHFNTGQSWKAGPMTYTVDGNAVHRHGGRIHDPGALLCDRQLRGITEQGGVVSNEEYEPKKILGRSAGVAAAAAVTFRRESSREADETGDLPQRQEARHDADDSIVTVASGNLIFISGVGYHKEGDIKVHTSNVLDSIKEQLESVGSSMEKVLKCNVYLNDSERSTP